MRNILKLAQVDLYGCKMGFLTFFVFIFFMSLPFANSFFSSSSQFFIENSNEKEPNLLADIVVSQHSFHDLQSYECTREDSSLAISKLFLPSFFTGRISSESESSEEEYCVLVPFSEIVRTWSEANGGMEKISEQLAGRYGGKQCSVTITWPAESWPPKSAPSNIEDSCNNLSESVRSSFLLEKGSFPLPRFEIANVQTKRELPTGVKSQREYNVNTQTLLRMHGNPKSRYRVKLEVVAVEVRGYGSPSFSLNTMSRWDYFVAGKRISNVRKEIFSSKIESVAPGTDYPYGGNLVIGEVVLDVKGNTEIDVTPKSRIRHYIFGIKVLSVEER